MSIVRATIVALLLSIACMPATHADDYGPHRGIREVRAAARILIHADVSAIDPDPHIDVTDVVVIGDDATARWTDGGRLAGLMQFSYRDATWWAVGSLLLPLCDDHRGDLVPLAIRTLVDQHIGLPRQHCDDDQPLVLSWVGGTPNVANADGYFASWNAAGPFDLANIHGRAPTDAEMSGPGANSIFYLYANSGAQPLSAPKSTLTVWCPFVLDPQVHYFIEFAGPGRALGTIPATLKDNTLTFQIPAFTAPPNADIRGEVDYLPLIAH